MPVLFLHAAVTSKTARLFPSYQIQRNNLPVILYGQCPRWFQHHRVFLYLRHFLSYHFTLKIIFMTSKWILCYTWHENYLQFIIWCTAFFFCFSIFINIFFICLAPVLTKVATRKWFGNWTHYYTPAVWLAFGGRANDSLDGTNPSAGKFFIQPFSKLYCERGCLRRIHVSFNRTRWMHHFRYHAFSPTHKVMEKIWLKNWFMKTWICWIK